MFIIRNYSSCPSQKKIPFERSFTSHPKSKYWSEENEIVPRNVFKSSGKKYKFDCDKCNHEFEISLSVVNGGTFCPYCANHRLCKNDCTICEEKSFASHPKSKYWSDKNDILPRNVFKSANKKYKFNCPNCDEIYEANLFTVSNGTWCSCTKYNTEKNYMSSSN